MFFVKKIMFFIKVHFYYLPRTSKISGPAIFINIETIHICDWGSLLKLFCMIYISFGVEVHIFLVLVWIWPFGPGQIMNYFDFFTINNIVCGPVLCWSAFIIKSSSLWDALVILTFDILYTLFTYNVILVS
jgi:hypothetical protein